jgi:hypothetical protein
MPPARLDPKIEADHQRAMELQFSDPHVRREYR